MAFHQTCWSLEIEPIDHCTSYVEKFNPCSLKKKKKTTKKKTNKSFAPDILVPKEPHLANTTDNPAPSCKSGTRITPRLNFREDYEYRELLSRLLNMLREDNLEVPEEKRRAVLMTPQVVAEGIHNTVCVNFVDLCRMMNRKPYDVMSFLLAEMGTRGALDKQHRLVMKARVSSKDFEAVVQRYIVVARVLIQLSLKRTVVSFSDVRCVVQ